MTDFDPETINARAAALQEATGERLSRMKRRNEALLQAQSRMRSTTATATSPDNAVQATVDSGGMLIDLRVSPTARGDIARLVLDTAQRAAAQIRSETHRLHEQLRAEGVLRDIPLLPPQPTSPPPSGSALPRSAPSRPKPASRDDDDDEPRAVLRDESW
ncbi:YbaB/EbfC family nucleoid-associated protein [Actinosynnema sp. NPDC050801]|uniref:YbaB/EbfC family nucleoid-associated protein n=1 Tax=unclassified Actinosynnema TaxID=2637065 RepID=UPI0033D02B58